MAPILFGIYKDVHVTEHQFFESKDEKHFWVHKMNMDNHDHNALVSLHIFNHILCSDSTNNLMNLLI